MRVTAEMVVGLENHLEFSKVLSWVDEMVAKMIAQKAEKLEKPKGIK